MLPSQGGEASSILVSRSRVMDRENPNELDPRVSFRMNQTRLHQFEESLFEGRLDITGEHSVDAPRKLAESYLRTTVEYHAEKNEEYRREMGADDLDEEVSRDLHEQAAKALGEIETERTYFRAALFFSAIALQMYENDDLSKEERRLKAEKFYDFGASLK